MKERKRRLGREAWYLAYLPIYLLMFALVERLITDNYWVSWCPLDDQIPFVRQFVLIYVLWYPLMLGMAAWLLARDKRAFVRYAQAVVLGLSASIAIFVLFPSGQNLRPEVVEGRGLTAWMVRAIYAADTNTNVFPSMHVVGTLAAMAAAFDSHSIPRWGKWSIAALGVLINASTVLIKQHSVLDIFGGIALFALVYLMIYRLPELRWGRLVAPPRRPAVRRHMRRPAPGYNSSIK